MKGKQTSEAPKGKPEKTKKHFTSDEDERLRYLVKQLGDQNWALISSFMPGRLPRQCRERYIGYLSPNLNKSPWTPEEDRVLLRKLLEYGPKWMKMVPFFKGRSDCNIKNRWYKHLKKSVSNDYISSLENAPYKHDKIAQMNLPDLQLASTSAQAGPDHDKKNESKQPHITSKNDDNLKEANPFPFFHIEPPMGVNKGPMMNWTYYTVAAPFLVELSI